MRDIERVLVGRMEGGDEGKVDTSGRYKENEGSGPRWPRCCSRSLSLVLGVITAAPMCLAALTPSSNGESCHV
jgi:hypothetical protein